MRAIHLLIALTVAKAESGFYMTQATKTLPTLNVSTLPTPWFPDTAHCAAYGLLGRLEMRDEPMTLKDAILGILVVIIVLAFYLFVVCPILELDMRGALLP